MLCTCFQCTLRTSSLTWFLPNPFIMGLHMLLLLHAIIPCLCFMLHLVHEQSLQEMLRKSRQQQQHNRKAKQHNATRPKQSFFKEKLAASGGTRTHDHQLSRRCSYQLSSRGSSAGWADRILHTNQKACSCSFGWWLGYFHSLALSHHMYNCGCQ